MTHARLPFLLVAAGIVLFGLVVVSHGSSPYTFDGNPSAPLAATNGTFLDGWDIQVHSRDSGTWLTPDPLAGQHGADCSAPPATHPVTSYADTVFQCKDHFMTSLSADGYGVIYLTPPELLDFANGGAVQFDLSTLRMSTRDWVDVWITPYPDNLALPFDQGDVDLQGLPRTGIHLQMSAFNGQTTFRCNRIDNFVETEVPSNWWETWFHSSATVRDTFRFEVSPTHLKFTSPTMLYPDGSPWTACDTDIAALGWTRGVVQFGHHSYNPTKDQSGVPATWHWDNVSIAPAVPFTIIRATQRYTTGGTVTFNAPAPANAYLRFAANGSNVTVNGQPARIQPAEQNVDRFKSYWMPIPEGTTSVTFAGNTTPNGPFFVQDVSIWSLSSASTPSPSATATSSATPTVAVTPSATPSPTVATSTPTATATRVPPTQTPTPPPPTPTPQACRVPVRQSNGSFANVQGVLVPYGSGRICVVP